MAELHRWHHSTLIEESNRNYGQNLIVWDVVFGTRFLPVGREPPADIGIPCMPGFPLTFWAHLASPFESMPSKLVGKSSADMSNKVP